MRTWARCLGALGMVGALAGPAPAAVQYFFSGSITVNGPTQLFVYDSPSFVSSEIA